MRSTVDFNRLELAVLWTLFYGDVFDFPMTEKEIHHFLIETPATLEEIKSILAQPSATFSSLITSQIIGEQRYFALAERASHVLVTRETREQESQSLWPKAIAYGRILGHIPFVRMVVLTGALSMRNASPNDDLDYMLVVKSGRVWLARLFAVGLVKFYQRRGVILCPNYVLADDALEQANRDTFVAHELAQMHPIMGFDVYESMRDRNTWAKSFLPNALGSFYETEDYSPRSLWKFFKISLEFFLSGLLGNRLEQWEQRRKVAKFKQQITDESAAQLDEKHVKGHFDDHGRMILARFQERLNHHDLPLPAITFDTINYALSTTGESAAD